MNTALFIQSLGIMGQGMLGVFVVMSLLALTITVLNRLFRKKKDDAKGWF